MSGRERCVVKQFFIERCHIERASKAISQHYQLLTSAFYFHQTQGLNDPLVIQIPPLLRNRMEEPKLEMPLNNSSGRYGPKFIATNWILTQDNKQLTDAISISTSCTKSLTWEEIATEESCVVLQPANANLDCKPDACIIDIDLTGEKVSRIGVVSEASVLEFFKESGEYAGTVFAELVDEYEGATVYFAQLTFPRPTVQASVKFTRINNNSRSNMYLYGMKLVIEKDKDSSNKQRTFEDIFKNAYSRNGTPDKSGLTSQPDLTNIPDCRGNFSTQMDACLRGFMEKAWLLQDETPSEKKDTSVPMIPLENQRHIYETNKDLQTRIELYIDNKFVDMEKRLMQHIDEAEARTAKKLDCIFAQLQLL